MGKFGDFLKGIGSVLPVVGPLIQGSVDAGVQRRNVDKTIAANRELAEYQYSKDLEAWNRQNEYNSPAAQMARLQGAGLNPNLIYGTGATGATGQARELPKFQAPTVQYNYDPVVDVPSVISQYQDFAIKQAQTDNLITQNRVLDANANLAVTRRGTEMFRTDLVGIQSAKEKLSIDQMRGLFPSQLEFSRGRVRQQSAGIDKIIADTDFTRLKADWYVQNLMASWLGRAASLIKVPFGMRGGRGFRPPQRKLGPYNQGNIDHILRNLGK